MKNLFIIKRIILDMKLSDEAFTVWCGLRNIMQKDVSEYYVSFNMIAYSVFNRVPTRRELDSIKVGYNELLEQGYIKVLASFNKTEFIVDLSALYYEAGSEYFADLTEEEMHKIMSIECNQNKYKLLRYFTCQVSTFNRSSDIEEKYRGKIGGMSLDFLAEMLLYSKTSIVAYNEILSENELLFVYNHGDFYQTTNNVGQSVLREIPNTYARYSDKELAAQFIEQVHGYKANKTENVIKSAKANKKRALGQKLNNFIKGKEYSDEEVRELFKYAAKKNNTLQATYDNAVKNGYKPDEPELIDLTIFEDYLEI